MLIVLYLNVSTPCNVNPGFSNFFKRLKNHADDYEASAWLPYNILSKSITTMQKLLNRLHSGNAELRPLIEVANSPRIHKIH